VIINLVAVCLLALFMLILSIALFVGAGEASGSRYGSDAAIGMYVGAFISLIVTAGMVTIIIIYFRAIMRVLSGIRYNLLTNSFFEFPSIKVFTILAYIGIGFTVLSSIIGLFGLAAANEFIYEMLYDMPYEVREVLSGFFNFEVLMGTAVISTIFNLAANAGIVVCLVSLNRLNNETLVRQFSDNQ